MPTRAPRTCKTQGCPTLTDAPLCPEHRRIAERARGSASVRGYTSPAWRRLRAQALARDLFKCQSCGALLMKKGEAQVDHIIPRAIGGPDELSNLQTLCGPCHGRKTTTTDGGFGRPRG